MDIGRRLFISCSLLMFLSLPAMAQVVVYSPVAGSNIQSPFTLSATADACSSETVVAMGYSLDSSPDVTAMSGDSLLTSVDASIGSHTVNVMSWGAGGAVCVTNVSVTVATTGACPPIPANAISVGSLQTLSNWIGVRDAAVKGEAKGSMKLVSSPSLSGTAREFNTSYKDNGDERYSVSFGDDPVSKNFFYDGWVYFKDSAANIANLELDMNQVLANGQTVIYGVQCDGNAGTWDYTINAGTAQHQIDKWVHTTTPCNPGTWSVNTWHHIQISYSRDDIGNITYNSAWLDGVVQPLNATVFSAAALGWGPDLITNFEVDGNHGSGSSTVYLDNLIIYRW
jgi:hypothetical protein